MNLLSLDSNWFRNLQFVSRETNCQATVGIAFASSIMARTSIVGQRSWATVILAHHKCFEDLVFMSKLVIVVHYHELWLKGGNRRFFLSKLHIALKRALEGLPVERILRPGDRLLIEFGEGASAEEALARIQRVFGIAFYAVARVVPRGSEDDMAALGRAAWEEIRGEKFATFAVRSKRSDKSFPGRTIDIEVSVGQFLVDQLRATGRQARVKLNDPDLTCRVEIPPGPSLLVYARKIPGPGGLPPNTAGRMTCLLSGGFDSAVAAHKMMKRGAHLNFVHFWGGGADPGESSVYVARDLVKRLVPWQFSAKLYLVPFEPIQREIVAHAPEEFRILLYRRMMLRIAERVARSNRALGLITGDSLAQVASQTLHNMAAVGAATRMPLYRPLVGDDKMEIMEAARKIGTHDISAEPFHDCCPIFLPRNPALHASVEELDRAESSLNIEALVRQGIDTLAIERYRYGNGQVEKVESFKSATA
jgi:tRNA uracil 4-sulfurtransferase